MEVECDDRATRTSSIKELGMFRKGRLGDDQGDVAVLTAIFVMVLLTLLPLVAYTAAIGQQPTVSFDQKYQGALGAAEAGVAVFVSELDANQVNFIPGGCTVPPTNGQTYSNCSTSGVGWANLGVSSASFYKYEAYSNSASGPFTIVSTGKTTGPYGTVYRTVEETVSQQSVGGSFTNYFLFAQNNENNNFKSGNNWLNGTMLTTSGYSGLSKTNCPNDPGGLQTSDASWLNSNLNLSTTQCLLTYGTAPPLPTSVALGTDIPAEATCTYYGPTYIVFQPGGGYTVDSPDTNTNTSSTCNPSPVPVPGNTSAYPPGSQTVNPGPNAVIYVKTCTNNCVNAINFENSSGNYVYGVDFAGSTTGYGSAVVEGTVDGAYTVAADNNIYISGPLCYGGASACPSASVSSTSPSKVLGLVATDSVFLGDADAQSTTPPPTSGYSNVFDTNPNNYGVISSASNTKEYFAYQGSGAGTAPLDAAIMAMNGTFAFRATNTGNDKYPMNFIGSVAVYQSCSSDYIGTYSNPGSTKYAVTPGTKYQAYGLCHSGLAYLEQSNGAYTNGNGNGPQFEYDTNLANAAPPLFPTSAGSTGAATFAAGGFSEIANSYQPLGLS